MGWNRKETLTAATFRLSVCVCVCVCLIVSAEEEGGENKERGRREIGGKEGGNKKWKREKESRSVRYQYAWWVG